MKVLLDEGDVISFALPVRIMRQVDALAIQREVRQVKLRRMSGELEIENAEAVHERSLR